MLVSILAALATTAAASSCTLSNVLGSHMVLQRAPASAMVWGFATPGVGVKTTLAGTPALTSVADATGIWRQALPPQPASTVSTTISFSCTSGESFELDDVLFGETVICGGQSSAFFAPVAYTSYKQQQLTDPGINIPTPPSPSFPPPPHLTP